MENEIATVVDTTPAGLLQIAVSQGADIDKLEKLMALQLKWEENEARKAYHAAMAAFKANPPSIFKDKKVSYKAGGGETTYNHASLANVTKEIGKALSSNGLSATWKTAQDAGLISVTCTVTHCGGYSESTTLSATADQSGGKNSIQAIGSTVSYLERYTIMAITGLASAEMDDDGRGSEPPKVITESQAADFKAVCDELKVSPALFLKYMKAESFETILTSDVGKADTFFKAKRGGK